MIGPKLDARSYAVLILMVIGVVISSTLVAQQFGSTGPRSTTEATTEVAAANRQIAEALQEIAKSNREIANSISALSRSVGEIKGAIEASAQQQHARTTTQSEPRAVDSRDPDATPALQMLR